MIDPASSSRLCFVNSKWTTVALKFNRCSSQSVAVDRASEVEARLVTQESSRRTHRSFPPEILRASISLAMVSADLCPQMSPAHANGRLALLIWRESIPSLWEGTVLGWARSKKGTEALTNRPLPVPMQWAQIKKKRAIIWVVSSRFSIWHSNKSNVQLQQRMKLLGFFLTREFPALTPSSV